MIKLKKRGIIMLIIASMLATFNMNPIDANGLHKKSNKKKSSTAKVSSSQKKDKLKSKISSKKKSLSSSKQHLAESKANYQEVIDRIDDTEAKIEVLDNQIEDQMDVVAKTNAKISAARYDITLSEKAIAKSTAEINAEQRLYYKRVRAMYMNGPTGYLELLLGSKSFIDFLERYQLTKAIMKFDNNLISSLKKKKAIKVQQKAVLVQKKNTLVTLQNQNKIQLAKLNKVKDNQSRLIEALQAEKIKYKQAIAAYNQMINAARRQLAILEKQYAAAGNSSTGIYSSDALVGYAAKFLNVKYVWGGNTPSGFDCSGFTKYVYAHFGIPLNRRAIDQSRQGLMVSKPELKAGDLVFFGRPVHHVGIYVGNNCFIHAPRRGDVIRITPLTRKDFVFGRRLR